MFNHSMAVLKRRNMCDWPNLQKRSIVY